MTGAGKSFPFAIPQRTELHQVCFHIIINETRGPRWSVLFPVPRALVGVNTRYSGCVREEKFGEKSLFLHRHTHAGSGYCFDDGMRGSRGRNETLFTLVLPMLRLVESSLFAALRLVRWYDGSMILNVN